MHAFGPMKSGILNKSEKKVQMGVDGIGADAYGLPHLNGLGHESDL